jgi:hypothetical protein
VYIYLCRYIEREMAVFENSIVVMGVKNVCMLYNFTVKKLLEMKCLSLVVVTGRVVAFVVLGGGFSYGRKRVGAEVVVI